MSVISPKLKRNQSRRARQKTKKIKQRQITEALMQGFGLRKK